jgi:hypothetical protein
MNQLVFQLKAIQLRILVIILISTVSQYFLAIQAFSINNIPPSNQKFRSISSLSCICINCSKVTNCKAYHFVESKHSQPHMNNDPTFTPRDGSPTIHVNIRTNRENKDEMKRLWSEHVEETRKAEEKMTAASSDENDVQENKLIGEKKYDLSVKTTYEYDVVACNDFVEDIGCWIRNMPEEIKLANPNFVPT